MKLLLMSGGRHPYEESTPVLEGFLKAAGHDVTVREDADALTDGTLSSVDILVFNTLREGDMALNPVQQKAMEDEIGQGKGFVCIHISGCVPDTWNDYGNITGGGWVMNKSFHPPYGNFEVNIGDQEHPCASGLSDFNTDDELYMNTDFRDGNDIFLSASHVGGSYSKNREGAEEIEMAGGTFPLAWTRSFGSGKVFVTLLGHDGLSHQNSGFQQLVLNGVDWAGS
jgi:type 1 glutamine amidotransferase